MLAALAGAVWNYTEYLLKRSRDEAQVALTRAKVLAFSCLGGVTAFVAQIVLIAGSIWIGGIS